MTATKTRSLIRNLTASAVCLALCLLLPFLTGQIPTFGSMLAPMHLPILLCGFICGWQYGLAVGFAAPLLRSLLFAMPPMVPTALIMAFELAAYGVATALLYRALPKKPAYVYVSLIAAMLIGRAVWGVAAFCIYGALGIEFGWGIFWAAVFTKAWPGMLVQLILIPSIVLAMRKSNLMV
ncbi:ECF transporter S component [Ruminococcaceae bacterium OttesenSCG-928-D13]|nr:ECF transporter S component [Ruminococcaceae bacterium OttesenSCG-928-D13]